MLYDRTVPKPYEEMSLDCRVSTFSAVSRSFAVSNALSQLFVLLQMLKSHPYLSVNMLGSESSNSLTAPSLLDHWHYQCCVQAD